MPSPTLLAPPALTPGATIAVVAPSGPFDHEALERGVRRLETRYRIRYGKALFDRKGYLAGEDEARAADLLEALADPEVQAIVAARGGYGATRLLDRLDPDLVRRAKKLLVGFSDVTALHALWARAGVRSVHGPMVCALGRAEETLFRAWCAMIEGTCPSPVEGLVGITPGEATGRLLGGNLAVFTALVGTPYAPPVEDAILFLEDVGERPYRVDRMLTTLAQAGIFDALRGVVIGSFTESMAGPDGVTVQEVLTDRLAELDIPVVAGCPAGHVEENLPLPFGATVSLDATRGTLRFLEGATDPASGVSS